MKFYRLEDKEGKGVYSSEFSSSMALGFSCANMRHPSPHNDSKLVEACKGTGIFNWFGLWNDCSYIFGFSSREQFRNWFYDDEFLKKLKERGIKLNLYQTKDFYKGNAQMIAKNDSLTLVGECDIMTGRVK